MAASAGHTAALRSTPAGVSSSERLQVASCSLLVLSSSAKRRNRSAGFISQQKETQSGGRGRPEAGVRAVRLSSEADRIQFSTHIPLSIVSRPPARPRTRHQGLVRARAADGNAPSQGSAGGLSQQQSGGAEDEGAQRQRDAAREALRALDQQLADLAGDPPPRPPKVGDAAFVGGSGTAPTPPSKRPLIGPDSSPDEWPEFDATFFTYSSLVLLVVTALVNWTFSVLSPREDRVNPEVVAAKQEKRAKMDALFQQVLGEREEGGPALQSSAPEVKVGADTSDSGEI